MSLNQSDKKRRLKIWMPKGTDRAINISILVGSFTVKNKS